MCVCIYNCAPCGQESNATSLSYYCPACIWYCCTQVLNHITKHVEHMNRARGKTPLDLYKDRFAELDKKYMEEGYGKDIQEVLQFIHDTAAPAWEESSKPWGELEGHERIEEIVG